MRCFYINLDSATERRRNLESSFRAAAPANWELIRIPALGPDDVADRPGTITAAEKGCSLSHRAAIAATLGDTESVLIVEDDTRFSKRTFGNLEKLLEASSACDLLFTDQTFLEVGTMLACAKQYARLASAGQFRLMDLSKTGFAAASAYVLHGRSKAKVLAALDGAGPLNTPYDILLRELVHGGVLSARVCLPFLTTLSSDAEMSMIQPRAWNLRDQAVIAFRHMLFIDRDLAAAAEEIRSLDARHGDDASRLFGMIFGTFTSDAFPDKW